MKYGKTYTPSIVSKSFIDIAHICFELWSSKNEEIARNCGALRAFVPRTQLKDCVADKIKEVEV